MDMGLHVEVRLPDLIYAVHMSPQASQWQASGTKKPAVPLRGRRVFITIVRLCRGEPPRRTPGEAETHSSTMSLIEGTWIESTIL